MTTYRLFAKNASGDTLFFTADADGADYLANLTAAQAFEAMTTRKSGHRWNDDTQRFTRNRIATFRLVHDSGHVETFTPEQAAAAIATPAQQTPAVAVENGQTYTVGTDLQSVIKAARGPWGVTVYRSASNYTKTYAKGEFEAMVADGRAVLLVEVGKVATDTTAESLAMLRAIDAESARREAADAERHAARIANVLSDWKGREIVLPSGRVATVREHDREHGTVRLTTSRGLGIDAAWYPAADIWRGLEFGSILTPDQIAAGQASMAALEADATKTAGVDMLERMLAIPGRDAASVAHVARHALQILHHANPTAVTTAALAELDKRHPARYVTATDAHGVTWHLVNAYGYGIEAGGYTSPAGGRFTIAQQPMVTLWDSEGPGPVWVLWTDARDGRGYAGHIRMTDAVSGWHWRADVEAAPATERVMSLSGARVHRRIPGNGLTLCGRQVSGDATDYDGPACTDCPA